MSKALRRLEDAREKGKPFFCTQEEMDFELDENTVIKVSGKACVGDACAPQSAIRHFRSQLIKFNWFRHEKVYNPTEYRETPLLNGVNRVLHTFTPSANGILIELEEMTIDSE